MPRKDAHDEELDRIAQRLRAERPQLDPLRLDAIKTTTMSRAQRSGRSATRRRLAVAGLTVGLMAATTGGVIAAGGASQSAGNAATAQYAHIYRHHHHRPATRLYHFHLQIPYNVRLTSVTVTLNGKTVFVLTGRQATRDFEVTLPCGSGIVKIIAVTSTGQTFTGTRLLTACDTNSRSKRSSTHGKSSGSHSKSTSSRSKSTR